MTALIVRDQHRLARDDDSHRSKPTPMCVRPDRMCARCNAHRSRPTPNGRETRTRTCETKSNGREMTTLIVRYQHQRARDDHAHRSPPTPMCARPEPMRARCGSHRSIPAPHVRETRINARETRPNPRESRLESSRIQTQPSRIQPQPSRIQLESVRYQTRTIARPERMNSEEVHRP